MVTMGQADRATGRGGEELRGLQGWFVSGAEHHGRHFLEGLPKSVDHVRIETFKNPPHMETKNTATR